MKKTETCYIFVEMYQKIFDLIKGTQHDSSFLTQCCVTSGKAISGDADQEYLTEFATKGRGVKLTIFVTKCL